MSWFAENTRLPVTTKGQSGLSFRNNLFGLVDDFFKDWDSPLTTSQNFPDKFSPPISFSDTATGYLVETELPGVNKKDISIDLHENVLTIKGEKKSFDEEKKDRYYRMERSHGSFIRSVCLPSDADNEKITAKLEDGVLKIEVGKSAEAATKKKEIKVN